MKKTSYWDLKAISGDNNVYILHFCEGWTRETMHAFFAILCSFFHYDHETAVLPMAVFLILDQGLAGNGQFLECWNWKPQNTGSNAGEAWWPFLTLCFSDSIEYNFGLVGELLFNTKVIFPFVKQVNRIYILKNITKSIFNALSSQSTENTSFS